MLKQETEGATLGWRREVDRQATLAKSFTVKGIGLHTGKISHVLVKPGAVGTGIVFKRVSNSVPPAGIIADWQNRQPVQLCTALKSEDGTPLRTIEHLLASLTAFAIDNVEVELDGEELPIFDGSAVPWCHAILEAGLRPQDTDRTYLAIRKPVEVREPNGHFLRVEPAIASPTPSFDIKVEFPGFGEMRWSGRPTPWVFLKDIAPSRSFGLLTWGLPLKLYHLFSSKPLLRGANLWTTGIVWRGKFIGGMHVEDEPVRHRVLDLIGDMRLAGYPIVGHVTGFCPRHDLNHAFVRAIMEDKQAWELVAPSNVTN